MNKAEIIAEIQAKPYYNRTIAIRNTSNVGSDIKTYVIELLEVLDKSATQKVVQFYVIDEGLPTELAYYKDIESVAMIENFSDKLKPLLKQYNASIIEKGETWALTETNIIVNTNGIYSIKKDRYFVVDETPLTIVKIG